MDTGGHPLTVGLMLLTMNRSQAYLRLAYGWKDELGEKVAARLKPEMVARAQDLRVGMNLAPGVSLQLRSVRSTTDEARRSISPSLGLDDLEAHLA